MTSESAAGIALIGMSLNNSYFSIENIRHLYHDAAQRGYSRVLGFLVEAPALENYLAIGKPQGEARAAIKKAGDALRNKIISGLDTALEGPCSYGILHWTNRMIPETCVATPFDPSHFEEYGTARKQLDALYRDDLQFKHLANNAALPAIRQLARNHGIDSVEELGCFEGHRHGFILDELAFLLASPKMLSSDVAYMYHKDFPILVYLLSSRENLRAEHGLEIPLGLRFEQLPEHK